MQTYEFFCQILHGRSSSNLHLAKKSDATKMTSHNRKATKQKSKKNDILLLNNSLTQRLAGTHSDQMFLPGLSCPDVADNSVCLGTVLFLGFFIVSETAHFGRKLPINCQCINLETNM